MRTLRLLLALTFFLSPVIARAVDLGFAKEDGGQAGAFLDYAASARSLGMGRAQAAVTDDAGATYWNPAALGRVDRRDVLALYSMMPEDTNFSFVSYAQPTVDVGSFGVGVVSLQSGDFDKRDALGNRTGTFRNSQMALLLSHGIAINNRYSFGSTVKAIRHSIDNFSGTGYGLDLGALARLNPRLNLALVTHNLLAPKVQLRAHADTYPRDLRLGLKYQPWQKLILATDLVKTQNRSLKPNVGAEYQVHPMLALRGGINETEVAAGLGFKMGDWALDYAFGYHDAVVGVTDLGGSHRIGFHMNFGKKYSDEAADARWKKKGQAILVALRAAMNVPPTVEMSESLKKNISGAKQVVQHNGFASQDLYEAQGYISYFEGDYERSFRSLSDALSMNPEDPDLVVQLEKARLLMSEEKTRKAMETDLAACKDHFVKGNYRASLAACENVLQLKADHVEAKVYAEDARKKIYEPVEREIRIARVLFDKGEYLDVLKHLNAAKQMDPENRQATHLMNKTLAALEQQAAAPPADTTKVIEINQNVAESRKFYGQGLLLYSQGKLQEAATAWGEAVKYDSENSLARNAYSRAIAEMREKAK